MTYLLKLILGIFIIILLCQVYLLVSVTTFFEIIFRIASFNLLNISKYSLSVWKKYGFKKKSMADIIYFNATKGDSNNR